MEGESASFMVGLEALCSFSVAIFRSKELLNVFSFVEIFSVSV